MWGAMREEPPFDVADWQQVEESEIKAEDGELAVIKWGGGSPEGFDDLAAHGPGTYQVRVHVRSRPVRTEDALPDNIHEEVDLEKGLCEEHFIQLWPIEN
jgi:hypothetical protein